MYYVYLLVSDDKRTYTGYTDNLKRRIREHNTSNSGYIRGRNWHLVYYEAYTSKEDAMRREKRLKDGRARRQLRDRISKSMRLYMS
jgi:putative endonuclease